MNNNTYIINNRTIERIEHPKRVNDPYYTGREWRWSSYYDGRQILFRTLAEARQWAKRDDMTFDQLSHELKKIGYTIRHYKCQSMRSIKYFTNRVNNVNFHYDTGYWSSINEVAKHFSLVC